MAISTQLCPICLSSTPCRHCRTKPCPWRHVYVVSRCRNTSYKYSFFRVSQDYPGICELSYRTYRLRCRGARPLSASVRPSDPIPSLIQQHATIDRTTSRRCIVPSFDVVLQSVFYTLPSEFPPCPVCCSISRHSQEVGPSRSHARSCPHSEEMRQGGGVGDSQITVGVENMGKTTHRATITAAIIRTVVEC